MEKWSYFWNLINFQFWPFWHFIDLQLLRPTEALSLSIKFHVSLLSHVVGVKYDCNVVIWPYFQSTPNYVQCALLASPMTIFSLFLDLVGEFSNEVTNLVRDLEQFRSSNLFGTKALIEADVDKLNDIESKTEDEFLAHARTMNLTETEIEALQKEINETSVQHMIQVDKLKANIKQKLHLTGKSMPL